MEGIQTKEQAIRWLLFAFTSPLVLMNAGDRQEAIDLATKYGITAVELIEFTVKRARNA